MININFTTFIEQLTPPLHRTVEIIGNIKAWFAPLTQLKTDFFAFADQVEYDLLWNGQVCNLEHLLNDQFDDVDRGIYITDAENIDQTYLFNIAEGNEETYLFNEAEAEPPLYTFSQSEVSQFHFIVNIPSGVIYNEDLLKFYVNKYKLAGKRWKIEII